MNRTEIEATVLRTLAEVVPEAAVYELDRTAPLRDQIEIDSLDYLNFVLGLETLLGLHVPPASYPLFGTVDGAADAIQELLEVASG